MRVEERGWEIEREVDIERKERQIVVFGWEMIVLGKKQSVLIDFLCWLNGGCLSGSHYLSSDLLECLHTSARTGALFWRWGLTRRETNQTQAHTKVEQRLSTFHPALYLTTTFKSRDSKWKLKSFNTLLVSTHIDLGECKMCVRGKIYISRA